MKQPYHQTDREYAGDGWQAAYAVTCVQCGNEFEAKRDHAAFCSPRCRTAHSRAKQQLQKRIAKASAAIDDLIEHLPRRGNSRTFDALTDIQQRIAHALAQVEGE